MYPSLRVLEDEKSRALDEREILGPRRTHRESVREPEEEHSCE